MKKLKVTVVGPTHPYKGGISHFTTILVQNLRKLHNVDFISWKRQYPAFLYPVGQKDTQSKQPIATEANFLLDFLNPVSWFQSFIQIRKNKSDLLVLTWVNPIQSPIYFVLCLLTKFFTKTKILYICHNVLPHENAFYDKFLIRLAFLFADSFIVHSSDDKKILGNLVKNKKIIKGFLPIFNIFPKEQTYDVKKIKKKLGLNKKVLLFFGYIRPYKGLKYLIQAMPKIVKRFPDISLLSVGEFWSKDKGTYLKLVNSLNIQKNVVFVDQYVPNEKLGQYFAVADVVVLPYVTATQSAALQTAYAFDKPVISTDVGGLKDVIKDGVTGYIIKPANTEDIVEKVKKFFAFWRPSGNIGKFKSRFSWENYVRFIN